MANGSYKVVIEECSKQLSAKQRIAIKDTTNAISLDEACDGAPYEFTPDFWAVLSVHNENAKDGEAKDYTKFVIVDTSGNKITTGSQSFWNAFSAIFDEIDGSNEEFAISAYKKESKNYKGKSFITCSIV